MEPDIVMVASAAATTGAAEHGSKALFHLFGLQVTSVTTTTWAIMALLVILSVLATRHMQSIPSGVQNVMETILEWIENFFGAILGSEKIKIYFPLIATMFIFIAFANYSGMLPSAGHLPGLAAPTSSLSITVGLAIITFFSTHILGFKAHGVGYLKHFAKPVALLLPLMVLEEFVRPLSLSLRLFGNIYGEEMVSRQIFELVPILAPLPLYILSLLFCLIQALVFTMLSTIYISMATGEGH